MSEQSPEQLIPAGRLKRRGMRAAVYSIKYTSKRNLAEDAERVPYPEDVQRPTTREDCVSGLNAQRPCAFASCKWHLTVDVNDIGSVKVNRPEVDIADWSETCALDVAERGGVTLEEIGSLLGVSRERARQLEAKALEAIGEDLVTLALANDIEPRSLDRRGVLTDCVVCSREFRREVFEYTGTCDSCREGKAPPHVEVELPRKPRAEVLADARAAGMARGPALGSIAYEQEQKRKTRNA